MIPFQIKDCALLTQMSGLMPAFNLRELRDRIAYCNPQIIYHHYCENVLAPTFDYPDFRNDFAVWVRTCLDDKVLAERLGIVNPYQYRSMEDLRQDTLDILDERLNELPLVHSVPPGYEFYFMEAITVVFDTGHVINGPEELGGAVAKMTNGSIYFHFLEARRRTQAGVDDFTWWLQDCEGTWDAYLDVLKSIDFMFYSLAELRQQISESLLRIGGNE
ncbi:MAG: hypothetical protein JW902_03280 [Syntrophaceae bacterium]|nr:hypothetical protein [Syntrophaceae bacterium]